MSKIALDTNILQESIFRTNASKLVWFCLMRDSEDGQITTPALSIAKEIKVNEKTVRNILKRLIDAGYIKDESPSESPNKVRHPTRVLRLCNIEIYNGRKKTQVRKKSEYKSEIKPIIPDYISPPFVAPEFREAWQMWIEYRKEINNNYKSEKSEKIGYEQMVKKSGNNPEAAKQMVEQSIANGYKGMFAVKDNNNGKRNSYPTNRVNPPRTAEERVADYQELAGAVLRRVEARKNK